MVANERRGARGIVRCAWPLQAQHKGDATASDGAREARRSVHASAGGRLREHVGKFACPLPDVDADNRVIDALPRHASASQSLAQVDAEFGGAMGVDVVVRWPDTASWKDQELVNALDEVHAVLAEAGNIDRAISYATIAGSLPPRARRRIKATSVNDIVDPENQTAIVRARVEDLGSRALESAYSRIETELSRLSSEHPG